MVAWYGVVWLGMAWCGVVWCGVVWSGSTCLDTIQQSLNPSVLPGVEVLAARFGKCSDHWGDVVVHMVPNTQWGKTALELARDTSTVEGFLGGGVTLSSLVTEEVTIDFVAETCVHAVITCVM